MKKLYDMQRDDIVAMYDSAWQKMQEGKQWPQISKELVMPSITTRFQMNNLKILPMADPTIVAVNHPSHMDYFFMGDAAVLRPDMQIVARVPTEKQEWVPSRRKFLTHASHFIPLLSKETSGYVAESLDHLRQEVEQSVSMIVVPWGCMDHQAKMQCTIEQAIENILRLSRRGHASLVTANIAIESQKGQEAWPGPLPFAGVTVTLGEKISTENEDAVRDAIRDMYERATHE